MFRKIFPTFVHLVVLSWKFIHSIAVHIHCNSLVRMVMQYITSHELVAYGKERIWSSNFVGMEKTILLLLHTTVFRLLTVSTFGFSVLCVQRRFELSG